MDMTVMEQMQEVPRGGADRRRFFGITLIVFGALMIVDRLTSVEFDTGWPFFAIALGVWKLVDAPPSGRVLCSRRLGVWLLFIGCWGLLNSVQTFGMDYGNSWPALVVGGGLNLVWRSFEGPDMTRRQER